MFLFLGGQNFTKILPAFLYEISITAILYGLYFGVLGRDISEVCTEYVAAKIGVRLLP
jgi:RING finger protein 121